MKKKKKVTPKKSKKSNSSTTTNVNKKSRNSVIHGENSIPASTGWKPKKTDKKRPVIAQDPPPVLTKLTVLQRHRGSNESPAQKFWGFVDPYVTEVVAEDINVLGNMMAKYSKENQAINIPPLNRPDPLCSLELPEDLVERIVGALVDPDLFPSEDDDLEEPAKRMKHHHYQHHGEDNIGSVFSDKSNFANYMTCTLDEDMQYCDIKQEDNLDEISTEILKCEEELKLLCNENENKLSHLSARVRQHLDKQDLRRSLSLCENELVKLSQKHTMKKLKKESTVNSSTRKSSDEPDENGLKLLIQRRNVLLGCLGIGEGGAAPTLGC